MWFEYPRYLCDACCVASCSNKPIKLFPCFQAKPLLRRPPQLPDPRPCSANCLAKKMLFLAAARAIWPAPVCCYAKLSSTRTGLTAQTSGLGRCKQFRGLLTWESQDVAISFEGFRDATLRWCSSGQLGRTRIHCRPLRSRGTACAGPQLRRRQQQRSNTNRWVSQRISCPSFAA